MKLLNIIFAILFLFFAGLQFIKSEEMQWIPIYIFSALVCFISIRGHHIELFYWITITLSVVYSIYLLVNSSGIIHHMTYSMAGSRSSIITPLRELLGLLIIITIFTANRIWLIRENKFLRIRLGKKLRLATHSLNR